MTRRSPSPATIGHLVEKGAFLLTPYHAECEKSAGSRETEFWRGIHPASGIRSGKFMDQTLFMKPWRVSVRAPAWRFRL